jgi:hypothetical protein
MKRALTIAGTLVLGLAATASAQPGSYAAPPEPAPAATQVDPVRKWGVGLRTSTMSITSEADEDNTIELGGVGLHVRYLLAPNWRAELTVEGVQSDDETLGFARDSTAGTLALHYVLNPYARWNWYALAGVGRTETEITYEGNATDYVETFSEGHVHVGLGLERRFDRISLGAEVRGVGLVRDDNEGDGELYAGADGPVPMESTAGQLNLHFTYYF